jgi:site-specific DNA-cytosine methylase
MFILANANERVNRKFFRVLDFCLTTLHVVFIITLYAGCHDLKEIEYETSLPNDHTIDTLLTEMVTGMRPPPRPKEPVFKKRKYIHDKYRVYKTFEGDLVDEVYGTADPISILQTSEDYAKAREIFNSLPDLMRPAVVLDLFAGVGGGIVDLKRLGIPMSKVVACEHDKVATHVFRENHDCAYSDTNEDENERGGDKDNGAEVEYFFLDKFEELEADGVFATFMETHGPIDILLAGPPCSDYSGANPNRMGVSGEQGSYMERLGELMKNIRKHPKQQQTHLHFMVENVEIRNGKEVPWADGDLNRMSLAFGVTWNVELDASYFSPMSRLRSFITNIPFDDYNFGGPVFKLNPSCCLNLDDDGSTDETFALAANIFEADMPAKVGTLMASRAHLDDDRMELFCPIPNKKRLFKMRHLFVKERAALMGYPDGYFDAVVKLFQAIKDILAENRHRAGDDGQTDSFHWKNKLDSKLHHFQGPYHGTSDAYRIDIDANDPENTTLYLKMCPWGNPKVWHTAEQYQKRLIGNAYSIPVVEYVLRPLQRIFPQRRVYQDLNCDFRWSSSVSDSHNNLPQVRPMVEPQLMDYLDSNSADEPTDEERTGGTQHISELHKKTGSETTTELQAPSPGLKPPPPAAEQGDETTSIAVKTDEKPYVPWLHQPRDGNQSSGFKPPPTARAAAAQLKGDETGSISVKSHPVLSSRGYLVIAKEEQKVGVNQHVPQNPPPPPPAQNKILSRAQQHYRPRDQTNPPTWKRAKNNYGEDV